MLLHGLFFCKWNVDFSAIFYDETREPQGATYLFLLFLYVER